MQDKYYDDFCKGLVSLLPKAKTILKKKDLKLWKYYEECSGRFIIPISVVDGDEEVSGEILSLLKVGYCMSSFNEGYGDYYCISNIDDSQGATLVNKRKDWLKSELSSRGLSYFTKISLSTYSHNPAIVAVADLLVHGNSNEYSLAWVVSGEYFVLIEVKELCW